MLNRSILNRHFRYDAGNVDHSAFETPAQSQYPADVTRDIETKQYAVASLVERIHNTVKSIKLMNVDSLALIRAYRGIKRFRISCCMAVIADKCSCLCTSTDRMATQYLNGRRRLDKRLDLVSLIKTQLDVQVLKQLLMLPQ